jgi:hypothetical protein
MKMKMNEVGDLLFIEQNGQTDKLCSTHNLFYLYFSMKVAVAVTQYVLATERYVTVRYVTVRYVTVQ